MTTKAAKAVPSHEPMLDVELDERHQDDVNAFMVRNRGALNDSIRRSREEMARGDYCKLSFAEILDCCRARHNAND